MLVRNAGITLQQVFELSRQSMPPTPPCGPFHYMVYDNAWAEDSSHFIQLRCVVMHVEEGQAQCCAHLRELFWSKVDSPRPRIEVREAEIDRISSILHGCSELRPASSWCQHLRLFMNCCRPHCSWSDPFCGYGSWG